MPLGQRLERSCAAAAELGTAGATRRCGASAALAAWERRHVSTRCFRPGELRLRAQRLRTKPAVHVQHEHVAQEVKMANDIQGAMWSRPLPHPCPRKLHHPGEHCGCARRLELLVPHGHSRTADRGSLHCARLQNLRWRLTSSVMRQRYPCSETLRSSPDSTATPATPRRDESPEVIDFDPPSTVKAPRVTRGVTRGVTFNEELNSEEKGILKPIQSTHVGDITGRRDQRLVHHQQDPDEPEVNPRMNQR
eukprot:Skav220976  [mRNA]  locus=scaffold1541:3978:7143:+ [translate_table: standard]